MFFSRRLSKWLLSVFLFAVCTFVLVLKVRIVKHLDNDGDGDVDLKDCLGIDLDKLLKNWSRCCDPRPNKPVPSMASAKKKTKAKAGGEEAGMVGADPDAGAEEDVRACFTLSEMVDRACLYTAMFSLYRAIRYTVSSESETGENAKELAAQVGGQAWFLIAAAVVTGLATIMSVCIERAAKRIDETVSPEVAHLYVFGLCFGITFAPLVTCSTSVFDWPTIALLARLIPHSHGH